MSTELYLDRNPRAKNCKIILNQMDNLFLQRSSQLDEEDIIHFSEYLTEGYKLFEDGLFDEPETLQISPWSEFNFRYGADSIRGTFGEMLSHMIRNSGGGKTRSCSYSHLKKDEVIGRDGRVYNPDWAYDYTSQVKIAKFSADWEYVVFSKDGYFQDKYTGNVDRLTLVDIDHSFFVEMSYPAIMYEIMEEEDSNIVESHNDYNVKISVENLEKYSRFKYNKIWLK